MVCPIPQGDHNKTDLVQLKSELVVGFMDGRTLGGPIQAYIVAEVIDLIRVSETQTGLPINAAKCDIIARSPVLWAPQLSNFICLAPDKTELLAAPLVTENKTDGAPDNSCAELNTALLTVYLCYLRTML